MKRAGVKQLKARLSEYLRAVKRGETVVVTEHDTVIAELVPPRRPDEVMDSADQVLHALAAAGEITRASIPKRRWRWTTGGLGMSAGAASRLLRELRWDYRWSQSQRLERRQPDVPPAGTSTRRRSATSC